MTILIDFDNVKQFVQRAAEQQPDRFGTAPGAAEGMGCVYVYQHRPCCLVGEFLFARGLDIDPAIIRLMNANDSWGQIADGLHSLLFLSRFGEVEMSGTASWLLDIVQRKQDRPQPWAHVWSQIAELTEADAGAFEADL